MNLFKVKGRSNIVLLVFLIVVIEFGGILSGLLAGPSAAIYQELSKPAFAPPGWVFPIVWTILYFLIAVALYRIILWGTLGRPIGKALLYFAVQLILNYLWSIIFFKYQLYGIAFFELIALLYFIVLTTIEFANIDKKTAVLMLPYIIWVGFAALLNFTIWIAN